jgi:hypothetical protein
VDVIDADALARQLLSDTAVPFVIRTIGRAALDAERAASHCDDQVEGGLQIVRNAVARRFQQIKRVPHGRRITRRKVSGHSP